MNTSKTKKTRQYLPKWPGKWIDNVTEKKSARNKFCNIFSSVNNTWWETNVSFIWVILSLSTIIIHLQSRLPTTGRSVPNTQNTRLGLQLPSYSGAQNLSKLPHSIASRSLDVLILFTYLKPTSLTVYRLSFTVLSKCRTQVSCNGPERPHKLKCKIHSCNLLVLHAAEKSETTELTKLCFDLSKDMMFTGLMQRELSSHVRTRRC